MRGTTLTLAASLALLGAIGPALVAGEAPLVRLDAGDTLRIAVPPGHATLLAVDAPAAATLALDGVWRTTRPGSEVGAVELVGDDPTRLGGGFLVTDAGALAVHLTADGTTLALPLLEAGDETVQLAGDVPVGPGRPRLYLLGVERAGSVGGTLTLRADAPLALAVAHVPLVFHGEREWPSARDATIVTPLVAAGASVETRVALDVAGALYGWFVSNGAAYAGLDRLTGPGYHRENARHYRVEGGDPGRWTFEAPVGAGVAHGRWAIAVDVPAA